MPSHRVMNRVAFKKTPPVARLPRWPQTLHLLLFLLFLAQYAWVFIELWLPSAREADARWPDGILVLLASATLLTSLSRQLPSQNVMLAAIIIVFLAGAIQTVGA